MPSEAIQGADGGKVRCRMINDFIPVDICRSEQGADECAGCSAPTRRCAKCGKDECIADAERGLCSVCAEGIGFVPRNQTFEGTPDVAMGRVIDRVRVLARGPEANAEGSTQTMERGAGVLPERPLLDGAGRVMSAVCTYYGIEPAELFKQDRHKGVAFARQMAMYLCRKRLDGSFPEIGRVFGGRDHTTVMHAVENIDDLLKTDPRIRQELASIEGIIGSSGDAIDPRDFLAPLKRPEETQASEGVGKSGPEPRLELHDSPRLRNVATLSRLLMEHGVERDGVWSVTSPVAILMSRAHLMRAEAHRALASLVADGHLQGSEPWSQVTLLKTEGIEDLQEKLKSPGAKPRDATTPYHRRAKTRAETLKPRISSAGRRRMTSGSSTSAVDLAQLPSARPIVTYGEMFAHLLMRAHDVHGEKLVGGALPMLQIRFKLSANQSTAALEWFVASGHVQQKDGWRTIILVSSQVQSMDGPMRPSAPGSARNRHTPARPVMRAAAPNAPTITAGTKIHASVTLGGTGTLASVVAELERVLPELRKKRDDLAMHVAQLEMAYNTLKALSGSLAQAQELADTSLAEATRMAQELLSSLR